MMQITKLELENFRNFYGLHQIEFAAPKSGSITVLIGENGAGKTTLMNAIHWVLTDKFTARLDNSAALINKDALSEGKNSCSVKLELSDDSGSTYRIRRSRARDSLTSELVLHRIKEGNSELIPSGIAKDYLSKIFPETLARWFIFDGEALGMMGLDGSTQFKQDLQQAFGFKTLSVLLDDLKNLLRKYEKEESSESRNAELQELQLLIEQNEILRDKYSERMDELAVLIKNEEVASEEYRLQLQGLERSSGLEIKRNTAVQRQKELKTKIQAKEQARLRLLETAGPALVVTDIAETLDDLFVGKEQNQSLPAPYGDRLIEDIRREQLCVCGRPVHPDSEEERQILRLLDTAGTSVLNHRISVVRSALTSIRNHKRTFKVAFDQLNSDINDLQIEITEQKQVEVDMTERINNIDVDKVRQLEQKRSAAEARAKGLIHERGMISATLSEAKVALERLGEQRRAISNKLTRDSEIRKKISKLEKLMVFVQGEFERQEQEVLKVIAEELSEVLHRYFTKHFKATVDPKTYRVDIFDIDHRPASLSTGEWMMVKFAFIATIVGMAAKNTKISSVNWISEPVVAPLVLDAPFSVLDPEYRANTAINLSSHVEQLILMTNSDAWNGDLRSRLIDKIGKRYLILSYAKGPALSTEKTISIDGEVHRLNFYESDRDESKILEV